MADILQDLPVRAPAQQVFDAISTPQGLDAWWTKTAAGKPEPGEEFDLGFGPEYQWRAAVTRCVPGSEFELQLTTADEDWLGTRVGFSLTPADGKTLLKFRHTGWPEANEHYRISCHCWAMYLRILRRFLEHGERVPYEERLDV
jgi:uncharacterized protein YndB with AHSA1/START domain